MSPDPSEECFVFASFHLYPKLRTLLRNDAIIPIGGRAFDLLLFLVSRAGVVVGMNELMRRVWPGVTVEEANLRVQMGMLRKILSQCEEAQRAIETVPLRGYCFILSVHHYANGMEPVVHPMTRLRMFPILLNEPVGRDETIATIAAALDEHRLVTVTGPGGIGKTTVAIAAAHRHATRHDGAISFVDLSHVSDGESAIVAIGEVLALDLRNGGLSTLCKQLQMRELLLVLDTCEHIVEPMAGLAEFLLLRCANLKLLVTTREALRATGEWVYRLSSLSFPDEAVEVHAGNLEDFTAITLFVDRVRSFMRFTVTEHDMPYLAEISRRLDGIPLALEFAAARVADMGLRDLAAHLDDRFEILTRGRRTALPRHCTLAAVFDWSYGLLAADEQRMLRQLARFGGWFSADRAIMLGKQIGCDRSAEALADLYEKSLLAIEVRDDAPVYRLLDTTRAYVRAKCGEPPFIVEAIPIQRARAAQA